MTCLLEQAHRAAANTSPSEQRHVRKVSIELRCLHHLTQHTDERPVIQLHFSMFGHLLQGFLNILLPNVSVTIHSLRTLHCQNRSSIARHAGVDYVPRLPQGDQGHAQAHNQKSYNHVRGCRVQALSDSAASARKNPRNSRRNASWTVVLLPE